MTLALALLAALALGADSSSRPAPALGSADALVRWQAPREVPLPAYDLPRAERLYAVRCAPCHGSSGDGRGPASWQQSPGPRDFTRGVFRHRSTPPDELPTHRDLFDTLTRGIPGTAMPSWRRLSEEERWLLVQKVERFSPRFALQPPRRALASSTAPSLPADAAERGRAHYLAQGCPRCHGPDGRGALARSTPKGERATPPASLRRQESLRGGARLEDVYRSLATGLDGTDMPGFADAASEQALWELAAYVRTLSEPG